MRDLLQLAKTSTPEAREKLLLTLTDSLIKEDVSGVGRFDDSVPVKIYEDIVNQLLHSCGSDTLSALSTKLAPVENAPHSIIVKLADDDRIFVARPVLKTSTVLSAEDLIHIASMKGDHHRLAMSLRSDLESSVTDVLITRSGSGVLRCIAQNQHAQLSEEGLMILIDHAQNDDTLQFYIVERQDLPETAIDKLTPILSEALREKLEKIRSAATPQEQEKAAAEGIDEQITRLCERNRLLEIAPLLARTLDLSRETIIRILTGRRDNTVAVICRASDLELNTFNAILEIRHKRRMSPGYSPDVIKQAYMSIEKYKAIEILKSMQEEISKRQEKNFYK